MARTKAVATNGRRGRRGGVEASGLAQSAERMIDQIEALVAEILALRADNEALRHEVQEAVAVLDRASGSLGGAGVAPSRRGRHVGTGDGAAAVSAAPRRRAVSATRGRGRATSAAVTPEVVRAAIGKLGSATARQIAEEISRAGAPVSGRAIRFFAEGAGATMEMVDGQRRYRLS